jgi:hypothetical protein
MRHQCNCKCTIRVGRGDGSLTLECCCLHDMKSHATDKSKYLKYKQIISLLEAAVTAQITDFCSRRAWPELMRKHNAQTNDYHLSLYEDVVIGHESIACRDIVRINLSSVWMLANLLQAIVAEWNFQLCGDVTGNFCSRSVDLFELSVTSIPCKNNFLCLYNLC